jgi:hypothetical protein
MMRAIGLAMFHQPAALVASLPLVCFLHCLIRKGAEKGTSRRSLVNSVPIDFASAQLEDK